MSAQKRIDDHVSSVFHFRTLVPEPDKLPAAAVRVFTRYRSMKETTASSCDVPLNPISALVERLTSIAIKNGMRFHPKPVQPRTHSQRCEPEAEPSLRWCHKACNVPNDGKRARPTEHSA
ncbi:hypothetical protein KCP77_23325 [Salmonella enterica subsp. enterica]|nr:hypothetical protein KCP77_23325 [Salmonella enterica subsp. enterica]